MENNSAEIKKNKSKNGWAMFAMLMLGIVIGFLIAPIKNGISCGNNNGNNNTFTGNSASVNKDNEAEE